MLGNLCAIIVDLRAPSASALPQAQAAAPVTREKTESSEPIPVNYQEPLSPPAPPVWEPPLIEELPLKTKCLIHKQHEVWPPLRDHPLKIQNVDGQPPIELTILGSLQGRGAYGMYIKAGNSWLPIQDHPPSECISPFYLTPDRGVFEFKSSCLLVFSIMKDHPDFIQLEISEEGTKHLEPYFIDQRTGCILKQPQASASDYVGQPLHFSPPASLN